MKKIIFAFLALSLIVFAGCKPDDPNKPDGPTGELRFLNENPLKMTKSTSKVLSLEGARFSEVDLTCSDENIVIVSPQGVATAGRTEGTVTVTATLKSTPPSPLPSQSRWLTTTKTCSSCRPSV